MKIRRVRLITGLVLLTYLATHLLNHALGLISLAAMEGGREWFLGFWRTLLPTIALYVSLATHLALALFSLYHRRHLRMPLWEALQLLLGLTIPPLLTAHTAGTRLAHEWFGVQDSYGIVVLSLWNVTPGKGLLQAIVLVVAWLHGCIGLHFWLRLRRWYPRLAALFFALALLLPVLALLGFAHAGREIADLMARQPDWFERTLTAARVPRGEERALLAFAQDWFLRGYAFSLMLVLLARIGRAMAQRRYRVRVSYPDGLEVAAPRGLTLLEISRHFGIPHASVCGGRGRCSTCRVRVTRGLAALPAPSAAEQRVLQRVGAPPNVRLACQLRPARDLAVTLLLPANAQASDGYAQPSYLAGQERTIAVLFADIRTFTGIAEQKLPYDIVFLLNSYFEAVGEAIVSAGGTVDKFIGDGVMALFGIEAGPEIGCRQAMAAAQAMVRKVNAMSRALTEELAEPLKIGIGIHCGPAVVGRMGYGAAVHVTAIGDTVNVASRLQDATKEFACHLVISEEVAKQSGMDAAKLARHELTLRNRREPLTIFVISDTAAVASATTAPVPSAGNR